MRIGLQDFSNDLFVLLKKNIYTTTKDTKERPVFGKDSYSGYQLSPLHGAKTPKSLFEGRQRVQTTKGYHNLEKKKI